jgi:3-hydroxyisobutyrate dehydrogenase-like beta-hydroxyacid dehydrogenase
MQQKDAVGVIGLGIMGGAFAKNLAAAGRHVIGYDIDAGRCRALVQRGVEIANDAKDVAGKAAVIITSLPKPRALLDSVKAIVAARARNVVLIETSTFAIKDKIAAKAVLARAGHDMLDCPVSGTGAQAVRKDIIVYASGASEAIRRLRPLFEDFSRGVYDLGEFGNGSKMKYVANLLVAINNVAAAEAMVFGMKAGLDPNVIHDMVVGGAANSRVFELRAPMMVQGRYDNATMKVSTWQKDMQVIGDFAKKLRTPTPLFAATRAIYAAAMAGGHAAHDTAAVCAVMEKQAGLRRGAAKKQRAKR